MDANGSKHQTTEKLPAQDRIAVRLNSVNTAHFIDDIRRIVSIAECIVRTLPSANAETDGMNL